MWSYAEGNETALTILVAIIVLGALAYVLRGYLGGKK